MRYLLCFIFSLSLWAQDVADINQENGLALGLGAGGTVYNTWGFIYREHFNNKWGVSSSLGGYFNNNRGYIGNEIGLVYKIAHHPFSFTTMPHASIRVHLVAYLANIYHYNDRKYDNTPENEPTKINKHVWDIGLGGGPGVEFFFNRHFALHLELPWMTFIKIDKGLSFLSSYPHFGGGVIYYF